MSRRRSEAINSDDKTFPFGQDTNILGFKGPRNMTVLLPGMTEEDQRVKISSADDADQGLLECWKAKVKKTNFLFKNRSISIEIRLIFSEHGQNC